MGMVSKDNWDASVIKVEEAKILQILQVDNTNSMQVFFVLTNQESIMRFRRMMDKISVIECPTFADHLGLVFTMANTEINPEG